MQTYRPPGVAVVEAAPTSGPTLTRQGAARGVVAAREGYVWTDWELIPATVGVGILVGLVLRLLLPVDVRYTLVCVSLAVLASVGVLAAPAAVLGAVERVVRLLAGGLARPALAGGRYITVRTHGGHGPKTAARHEAGHVLVAKTVGAKVASARIYPDGSGITRLKIPGHLTVPQRVAIDVAGEVAAGTKAGCASDQAFMREALRTLPAKDRAGRSGRATRWPAVRSAAGSSTAVWGRSPRGC